MGRTRNSKRWSEKDLKLVHEMMLAAEKEGLSKYAAKKRVGEHFGVTPTAIDVRYNRWLKGMKGTRRNTNKVPVKRKYGVRGPYKKKAKKSIKFKEDKSPVAAALAKRLVAESNRLVFPVSLLSMQVPKIKEIIVDFDNRSITYTY